MNKISRKKGGALFILFLFSGSAAVAMKNGLEKKLTNACKDQVAITFYSDLQSPIRILLGSDAFTAERDLEAGSEVAILCPRAKTIRCWALAIESDGRDGQVIGSRRIVVDRDKESVTVSEHSSEDYDSDHDSIGFFVGVVPRGKASDAIHAAALKH